MKNTLPLHTHAHTQLLPSLWFQNATSGTLTDNLHSAISKKTAPGCFTYQNG